MSANQNSQKKYPFELEPFSRAFLENRNKTMEERIALGMREAAKYLPISFPENCMLPTVGVRPVNGAVGYIFGGGIFCEGHVYDRLCEEYPEYSEKLFPALPDEKSRRVGQSVAAASLPEV